MAQIMLCARVWFAYLLEVRNSVFIVQYRGTVFEKKPWSSTIHPTRSRT